MFFHRSLSLLVFTFLFLWCLWLFGHQGINSLIKWFGMCSPFLYFWRSRLGLALLCLFSKCGDKPRENDTLDNSHPSHNSLHLWTCSRVLGQIVSCRGIRWSLDLPNLLKTKTCIFALQDHLFVDWGVKSNPWVSHFLNSPLKFGRLSVSPRAQFFATLKVTHRKTWLRSDNINFKRSWHLSRCESRYVSNDFLPSGSLYPPLVPK